MGWKQYLGLEYVDYTDQIFQSLVKTRYAKRQFSLILSLAITLMVRWHIKIIFACLFQFHPIIDFIFQILLSIILVFKNNWIRNLVNRFQGEIYALSRYLINNYTPEHYRIWKRNATVGMCLYFIVHLMFVQITSAMLIEQILQFLISYFIIDGVEQGTFARWWGYVESWYEKHWRQQGTQFGKEFVIRDDYLDVSSSEEQFSDDEEEMPLRKSWMGLNNVTVIEDSPERSIVVFQ